MLTFFIIVVAIIAINSDLEILPSASHRYLNALNPFLTTTDPLVDSVSEHATTYNTTIFFVSFSFNDFFRYRDLVDN